jgi:DNA-binding response OmpR family regulator
MNILVIDDDPDLRTLIRDLLEGEGHHVSAAPDAVVALALLQVRRFDLILLDLLLPGIEGYRLAEVLTTRWDTFDIPVVAVSCRGDPETRSWARIQGCSRFLAKPFGPAELLDLVREIFRKRAEKSGPPPAAGA